MKKLIPFIVALTLSLNCIAEDTYVEIESLGFILSDTLTAELLPVENVKWYGFKDLPETVDYNAKTYTLVMIGEAAFFENDELVGTRIPATVDTIALDAFGSCTGLEYIYVSWTAEQLPNVGVHRDAFSGVTTTGVNLYVPEGLADTYKASNTWNVFNIIAKSYPSAVDNINPGPSPVTKFVRDGQLLIQRNGKVYTLSGVELE
ncbi:MAG: hypothetical protein J5612_01575 [Paludibacteraceae bacterium]|nr:hypothetical protein [Paludibacteraceae bacterium]